MDYCTRKLLKLTDKCFVADKDWLEEKIIKGIPHHLIKGTWIKPCNKCPHCHSRTLIKHGTYQTKTLLPKFRQVKTVLHLKRTRYRCKTCLKTCSSSCSLVDKHCCISKELKQLIAFDLTKNISRKHICQDHFVSDVTVQRVLIQYTKQVKPSRHYLPSVLCIDEFKSVKSSAGKMSFICVDGITKRIIDVLPSRKMNDLIPYFNRFSKKARESVRYLVMDMNANYGKLIQTVFPNAIIVTDRFHIIQHIHRNLNTLRIKEMNSFRKDEKAYKHLKKYWKLLLKDGFDVNDTDYRYHHSFKTQLTQAQVIDRLLAYSPVLKQAYEFVQELRYAYRQRDFDLFMEVLQHIPPLLPEWFRRKFDIFKTYRHGIYQAFITPYSNGITEAINNHIKVIKRVAYGYRRFSYFRLRILIIQHHSQWQKKEKKKVVNG